MDKVRIDKWLWAARFYKTRSLAVDEIDKGRVVLNRAPVKPAREVKVGDVIEVSSPNSVRTVTVLAISDKRGGAPVAALLYQESEASIAARLKAAEQRRLAPEPALSLTAGRPTKRERRDTDKLRANPWNDRWSASID